MLDERIYQNYIGILKEEMIPAMGCTEPIALAYGAARAREVLGKEPEHITAKCSGNIIKNVRCVIIPNSGGLISHQHFLQFELQRIKSSCFFLKQNNPITIATTEKISAYAK